MSLAVSEYFSSASELLSAPVARAAYSDRMAWILASMAELAYEPFEVSSEGRDRLVAKLTSGSFELVETLVNAETDTQALLVSCDRFAVLVFRGTQPTHSKDLATDLDSWKVSTLSGKVHAGFMEAYGSVASQVATSLSRVPELPLYISGHSLGAALATVCTQQLEQSPTVRDRIAACYTFGSPRVGDDHYEQEFKSPIYRVVNAADPVTVVPLGAMGFIHVGDIRFLGRHDGQLQRYVPRFRSLQFLGALSDPLADHAIGEYRRKLEVIARRRNPRDS